MPLSAGAADKFGNRYEGRWTVFQMIEVMAGRAASLRLEPPGEEGQGIELWVRRGRARLESSFLRNPFAIWMNSLIALGESPPRTNSTVNF